MADEHLVLRLPRRCHRAVRPRRRSERGAVAVEFGLLVPLLLLLVFGIIDFGYMTNRDTMIVNASRDGARLASLDGSYAQIVAQVKSELASYGIPTTGTGAATVTVDCLLADGTTPCNVNGVATTYDTKATSGTTAVVTVDYQYHWITPVTSSLFGNSLHLHQQTQMRIE